MTADALLRITEALRDRLTEALALSGVPGTVFVGPLDDPDAGGAALVLFLYRVVPNASLRNREHRVPSSTPGQVNVFQNALPLDLYYLLTVGTTPGASEETLLRALGFAMQALQGDPDVTGPAVNYETVRVTLEPLTTEEASRIWTLFPTANYRTSIAYLATPVWIDPPQVTPLAARVTENQLLAGSKADQLPAGSQPGGGSAMNRPFEVRFPPDKIALRRVLFAIELLDAVTLDRVSQGVKVKAHGLQGKPIVNAGGLFVWLNEDISQLERISVDPRTLPYEEVKLEGTQLQLPLTTIELSPRVDYPFTVGTTGLRGTLVEDRYRSDPVLDAEVRLRWLDQDGNWPDAPTRSHTTAKGGDFVAILRFAPSDEPQLDEVKKNLTVRLRVRRGDDERGSVDLTIPHGRVTSLSTPDQFVFAWNELEP